MKTLVVTLLALSFFAAVSSNTHAGPTPKPYVQQYTLISTVSADSITTIRGINTKTYKITPSTNIQVKGKKAKVEELAQGMRVSVTAGSDATIASIINASEAPLPTPKKK